MSLIRILIWGLLFYFLYRLLRDLFSSRRSRRPTIKSDQTPHMPPPYDPTQVEDIDYQEVEDRRKDSDHAE
ncbi:MAG: hypothetical protein D6681_04985 [Calditrichaeota bacterium]|nr:MAG: hypothetical protein D6681_04985 [Calditrichota bacterium]